MMYDRRNLSTEQRGYLEQMLSQLSNLYYVLGDRQHPIEEYKLKLDAIIRILNTNVYYLGDKYWLNELKNWQELKYINV